jgi:hypothetical protein
MPAEQGTKGGPPDPYPLPNPQLLTPDMTGIGKVPMTDTTENIGVIERDARTKMYRTLRTT